MFQQLVNKFTASYVTRSFTIAFARDRYLSVYWATSIQYTPSHPITLRSILMSHSHLRPGLVNGLFPSGFSTKIHVCISLLPPTPGIRNLDTDRQDFPIEDKFHTIDIASCMRSSEHNYYIYETCYIDCLQGARGKSSLNRASYHTFLHRKMHTFRVRCSL